MTTAAEDRPRGLLGRTEVAAGARGPTTAELGDQVGRKTQMKGIAEATQLRLDVADRVDDGVVLGHVPRVLFGTFVKTQQVLTVALK